MKSIKFEKVGLYARLGVQKIEVDETKLKFINGLAVAEAKVTCYEVERTFTGYNKPKQSAYFCEGVINENFEEAYPLKNASDAIKFLSFRKQNRKIFRFGPNDFVVVTENKETYKLQNEFTHIRLVDQKPIIVKDHIKNFSITSTKYLVIVDYQFYNIITGQFIGPKFKYLDEDPRNLGEYIVVAKIKAPATTENESFILDELSFRMNEAFELASVPESLIEEGPVYFTTTNYYDMYDERIRQLQEKRAKFRKHSYSDINTYKL